MLKYQLKSVSMKTAIVQKKLSLGGVANININTALVALTHHFLPSSVIANEDLMGLN